MLRTSVVLSLLSLLGSAAGFLSNLAIATTFGANAALDAYLAAASVPTLAAGLFSAMVNYSLVPHLLRLQSNPILLAAFARKLLTYVLAFSIGMAVLGFLIGGSVLALLDAKQAFAGAGQTALIASTAWIAGAAIVMMNCVGCLLSAKEKYYPVAVASIAPSIGVIAATTSLSSLGVVAIPLGMFVGAVVGLSMLLLHVREVFVTARGHSAAGTEVLTYFAGLPSVLIAMSCFSSYALIDAIWAPRLGAGNLSYLGYAQRILIAVGGITLAGPMARVVPEMSKAVGYGRKAVEPLLDAVWITLTVATGIGAVLAVTALPAISLVFQRGQFDALATRGVAQLLPIMLVGAVPMLGSVILFKGLFQLQLRREAAWIGAAWTLSYFSLGGVLSERLGVQGLAVAYAASWWAAFIAGLLVVLSHVRSVAPFRELGKRLVVLLLASSGAVATAKGLAALWGDTGGLGWVKQALELSSIAVGGLAAYTTCCIALLRGRLSTAGSVSAG